MERQSLSGWRLQTGVVVGGSIARVMGPSVYWKRGRTRRRTSVEAKEPTCLAKVETEEEWVGGRDVDQRRMHVLVTGTITRKVQKVTERRELRSPDRVAELATSTTLMV